MRKTATERFLEYVKFNTASSSESDTFPSTPEQFDLARYLVKEMMDVGISNVVLDEQYGYVYGKIPATPGMEDKKTVAFLAHMDTSEEASGKDVKARLVPDYDGKDILLNEQLNIVMAVDKYPELSKYTGKTLIVTDGTTLLGADDKAGIAEIMTMAQILIEENIPHGPISIAFTPDEEVGAGVDYINLDILGADYAYTVDGGSIGELEYENFNAASASITISGTSIHPGDSKNKMINASRVAMKLDSMIPDNMRPETTEGYEGFFHLDSLDGSVESAKMYYIIRDHSKQLFADKKQLITDIVESVNHEYGGDICKLEIKDQYFNMKDIIDPDYLFLVEYAKSAYKKTGVEPVIKPVRGGTDGARLSYMGLPCPNICTGGRNYHGRFEYCCSEDMETVSHILVNLTSAF